MAESFRQVRFVAMSGTGNTFAVVDTSDPLLGPRPAWGPRFRSHLARELCAPSPGSEERFDGVLFVARHGVPDADASMEVWNADGSRAAACGNGLRVVAKYVADGIGPACKIVSIATDSGVSTVDVELEDGRAARATATLGRATPFDGGVVRHGARELAPDWIEIGNRHAVLFVPEVRLEELEELGPVVERSFEGGVNVELVAPPSKFGDPFTVRVWERGVGETAACGSGACAVAAAARARGLADETVDLDFPGGRLRVAWSDEQGYRLTGDCVELGSGVIALAREPDPQGARGAS